MKNAYNKDYIDYPKTSVYTLLSRVFGNDRTICCHYTSTTVLDLLLSRATFRASHLFYLNDSSELINGVKQLKKMFENSEFTKTIEILDGIKYSESKRKIGLYSISFSSDPDLLHQWITYAKESGVCLVLDRSILKNMKLTTIIEDEKTKNSKEKLLSEKSFDDDPISVLNRISVTHDAKDLIYAMRYDLNGLTAENVYNAFAQLGEEDDTTLTRAAVDEKWEKAIADGGGDARLYLLLIASLLKNKDFKSEEEIRAIFFAEKEGTLKTNIRYFPMSNGVLRPYCEIVFCDKEEKPMLPLQELVVGPSGNQQAVFDSVVHRIKYGEKNIFDYWNPSDQESFNKNFYSYVLGSIKRYLNDTDTKISEELACQIFDELKKSWENENGRDIISCTWEGCLAFNEMSQDFKIYFCDQSDDIKLICNKIMQDNYFSREGVWIRKSQIPYIF